MPSSTNPQRGALPPVVAYVVALLGFTLAPLTPAADVSVIPSADTFLFADEPNSNYGSAGQLSVSDPTRPQGQYQSLLRFDLAAAKASFDATFGPGQWRLQAATLRLSTANPNNAIFNPNTAGSFGAGWMQNDAWVEGTGSPISPTSDGVTFNTLPSFLSAQDQPLGTFNFPGGNSGAHTYALNFGPGLTSDLEAGDPLSIRLFPEAGGTVAYNFSSRTFQTAANRPLLTLSATAVPEPATGAITAVFTLLLAARRRRRAAH